MLPRRKLLTIGGLSVNIEGWNRSDLNIGGEGNLSGLCGNAKEENYSGLNDVDKGDSINLDDQLNESNAEDFKFIENLM